MRRLATTLLAATFAASALGHGVARAAVIANSWMVFQAPLSLGVDRSSGKVYVSNSESVTIMGGQVAIIDPTANTVTALGTSLPSNFVLVDDTHRRLYSSNATLAADRTSLDAFDLDTNAPLGSLPVGGLQMALDSANGRLYVAEAGRVRLIDTASFSVVATELAPSPAAWFGLAVDPARGRLYVTNINQSAPSVFVLNALNLAPIAEIPLATVPRFAIAVDPLDHRILVGGSDPGGSFASSALTVIDPNTFATVHTTSTPGFPLGIAVDSANHRIFMSDAARFSPVLGHRVYVIDESTYAVTETLGRFTFDPGMPLVHPDGRLYLPDYNTQASNSSTVVAIDLANHAPVFQSITLSPSSVLTNDTVHVDAVAVDPDMSPSLSGEPVTYSYEWYRNGGLIAGANGPDLDLSVAGHGDRGDTITARVIASDGRLSSSASASIQVADSPATVSVQLGNYSPKTNDSLPAWLVVTDPDNDSYGCTLAISINGVFSFDVPFCSYTFDLAGHANANRGDTVTIAGTATDNVSGRRATGSVSVVVVDTAPTLALSVSDATPNSRDVLVASVSSDDADGDAVTYTYVWSVNGVAKPTFSTAATSDSFDLAPKGNGDNGDVITVSVMASDGTLSSATQTATATVTPGHKR